MKRKHLILPLTVFGLLISFGLSACNNGNGGGGSTPKSSQTAQQSIKITAADGKNKLILGESVQLTASVEGVSWEAEKPEIASVNASGLVESKAVGSTKIFAKKDGFKDGSITITVDLQTIKVTASATSVVKGEKITVTADQQGVKWESADPAIATVNDSGEVTGVAAGTVTIKASKDGFNPGSVSITVTRPAPTATLHMEDADHYTADGMWGTDYGGTVYGPGEESPVYERTSGNASDGKCIAYMDNGDKEILTFNSSAAVKAELVMMMAARAAVEDMSTLMEVKLNETAIDLAGKGFEGGGDTNTFVEFSFGELNILEGKNVMEFNFTGASPYMDDLNFYAESAVTITVVLPPEKLDLVLGQENLKIAVGKTAQITSEVTGLTYKSANTAIASVDENGLVTGVAAGSTTINVSKNGYKTVKLPVEVVEAEGAFKVNINNIQGDGVVTKESHNLTAPDNVMIDTFEVGAVATLEFDVEKAGTYTMTMKARASGGYSATEPDNLATCMELKVNGTKLALTGEVTPGTFATYTLGDVTLTAGKNTIEITCVTSVPGINLFNFIPKA